MESAVAVSMEVDNRNGAGPVAAPLLTATGVEKRYGGVTALAGASFEARAGEVHALLGENGAGKSTFVKMLTGAVTPDTGVFRFGEEELTRLTPRQARDRGITAVFQELSLIPALTGAENIWFPHEPLTRLRTRSRKRMVTDARELFDRLGFPHVPLVVAVEQLSIAQRQLIEIAKAVAPSPRVLILDEATSALGPAEADIVRKTIRELAARGTLCILISHRIAEVRAMADRVTVFRNGSTVSAFEIEAKTDSEIVNLIIGRRLDQLFPPRSDHARGEVVLRATGLSSGHLLKSVDLEVRAGEILGVGGLQGQGQLQLFLRLFGALRGGGEIEIGDRPVRIRSPRHALRAGVGCALIPEDRQREGLLLDKSVRVNLTLARLAEITRWGFIRRRAEDALVADLIDRFDVATGSADSAVGNLSGGNQQKVVIGKFMGPGIKVLLWFDPTRGIDVGTKHAIFELIHRQAAEGMAVLFFSTESEELINVCDRVMVMSAGRTSAVLDRTEADDQSLMRAALGLERKESTAKEEQWS
jgi:ribose transport system ATP-binding protein